MMTCIMSAKIAAGKVKHLRGSVPHAPGGLGPGSSARCKLQGSPHCNRQGLQHTGARQSSAQSLPGAAHDRGAVHLAGCRPAWHVMGSRGGLSPQGAGYRGAGWQGTGVQGCRAQGCRGAGWQGTGVASAHRVQQHPGRTEAGPAAPAPPRARRMLALGRDRGSDVQGPAVAGPCM
jgi:hypothetical protein